MSVSETKNLWPLDIAITEAIAPANILKEQGSLLRQRTNNLIEGKVVLAESPDPKNPFCYYFYLVAPVLGGYRYQLFSMLHDVGFYPLTVDFDGTGYPRLVYDADEFLNVLTEIFASEKTKAIIGSLIAQCKA